MEIESGLIGYLVTAEHNGERVQNVVVIDAEKNSSLTDLERSKIMRDSVCAAAAEKFGSGVEANVTWVESKQAAIAVG